MLEEVFMLLERDLIITFLRKFIENIANGALMVIWDCQ